MRENAGSEDQLLANWQNIRHKKRTFKYQFVTCDWETLVAILVKNGIVNFPDGWLPTPRRAKFYRVYRL